MTLPLFICSLFVGLNVTDRRAPTIKTCEFVSPSFAHLLPHRMGASHKSVPGEGQGLALRGQQQSRTACLFHGSNYQSSCVNIASLHSAFQPQVIFPSSLKQKTHTLCAQGLHGARCVCFSVCYCVYSIVGCHLIYAKLNSLCEINRPQVLYCKPSNFHRADLKTSRPSNKLVYIF